MSKRILSMILTLTLVLGSMSMAFAADVPADVAGTSIESAVERLGKLGILTGYDDGEFKADNDIKRSEFAAVVSRARGLEQAAQNSKGNTAFFDVPAAHWASGYVKVADDAGLVKGMGVLDGKNYFRPDYNITYEQAVTLVVRALGYETEAQKNGGYPSGHLIVASQIGLLKGVNGVAGVNAKRGLVAQLVDNALEIPKMVDVGYGHIVSGTNGSPAKFLFDDMQLTKVKGILKADSSKNKVSIGNLSFKVIDKDFDYAGTDGLEVELWYNKDNELVTLKKTSGYTAKFDAVKINKDNKVTTVMEDVKYDLADNVTVKGDVSSKAGLTDKEYNFAKIVLNGYGEITTIEVYNLDQTIVVKDVKENIVNGYNTQQITNSNDYIIVKNGKQILAKDLKAKDVVLYNSKEKYAAVTTDVREGKIERVYDTGFKFDGKTYDYTDLRYINGEDLEVVDENIAEEMQKNGNVAITFSFDNKALLIDGEVKEVSTNYVMVQSDSKPFTNRGEDYKTLDVVNSKGELLKLEVKLADIKKEKDFLTETDWNTKIVKNAVINLTLDSKNNPTKVELPVASTINTKINVDSTYINGFRTKANAPVFWKDGESNVKDYKVMNWSDANKSFTEINSGTIYADDKGNVVAVYAATTNNETKTEDYVGIVRDVKKISDKEDRYDVTFEINGVEKVYEGNLANLSNLSKNAVVALKLTKDNEIKNYIEVPTESIKVDKISGIRINDKYNMRGQYYKPGTNELEKINVGDVKKGDTLKLYFQPGATSNVQVAVVDPTGRPGTGTGEGTVSYTAGTTATVEAGTALALDVQFNNTTGANVSVAAGKVTGVIVDKDGASVPVTGLTATAFTALKGKTVGLGTITNSIANVGTYTIIVTVEESATVKYEAELTLTVKAVTADADAAKIVVDEIAALGATPTKAAVTSANTKYTALSANGKALVTNYATLKAFTDDIAAGGTVAGMALTTNKEVKDARTAYNKLGALGKAEVTVANIDAAELALANAKTAFANAKAAAKPVYTTESGRLASFTAIEITAITAEKSTEPMDYNTLVTTLGTAITTADAFNAEADAATAATIGAATTAITTATSDVTTAKAVFDALTSVIATGK